MQEILLFVVSILPVVLIGLFVYKKDREKEPTSLILSLFLAGVFSVIFVLIISEIFISISPVLSGLKENMSLFEIAIHTFIGIAIVEEFFKWIFVYKIGWNNKEFDHIYDMIVYAVFVSLGFAAIENLFYVYQYGVYVGIMRAFLAVPGHAIFGVVMGYCMGMAKINFINNNNQNGKKYFLLSFILPVLIHGTYNFLLMTNMPILIIIFFVFIALAYKVAFKKINKLSGVNERFKYRGSFCPNCGNKVSGFYCSKCGRKHD